MFDFFIAVWFTFYFWCYFNFAEKGGGAGGASSASLGDKEKTSEEKESECKGSEDGGDGGNKEARDSEVWDSVKVYWIWLFLNRCGFFFVFLILFFCFKGDKLADATSLNSSSKDDSDKDDDEVVKKYNVVCYICFILFF